MKQHETHRLPDGAFTTTRVPRQGPSFPPRERHILGEGELPPPRFRIPLTSTPVPRTTEDKEQTTPPD